MNKDVTRSLFQRSFSLASGVVSTFSVPFFLTADQQGYYYTFAAILAIQVFFELGLAQVLLYKFSSFAIIDGGPLSLVRSIELKRLLYASRRIYIAIALLFFLVASAAGSTFFSHSSYADLDWHNQWLLLVFVTSINLIQSVKLVFLESQGKIADVATLRLKANFFSTILLFLVLALGGGLWATCVVPTVNAAASSWWIYMSSRTLVYRQNRNLNTSLNFSNIFQLWRQEVFPLQWRMSLSWLSGYFIFQLITPITFSRFGPAVAGQLGFAISAMNSILFVATTFTSVIAPRLSSLFHSGMVCEYNSLFDRSFVRSITAVIVLSVLFVLTIFFVSLVDADFASRFLSWKLLSLYSLTVVASAIVYCLSIYLRSQAIEPLVLPSIVTAAMMAPSIWAFSNFSLRAMLIAMFLVTFLSAIWVWRIYSLSRRSLVGQCA